MTPNFDFEEYIATLERRLALLETEKKEIEADLQKAKDVLRKFQAFNQGDGLSLSSDPYPIKESLRRKFEGLPIRKCLQIIAKENDNTLIVGDARMILHQAGRITKNLSADIVRNPEFLKTDKKGIYHFDESRLESARFITDLDI